MKGILIWILVIFLCLSVACKKQERPASQIFVGGKEGLVARVLEGAPPPVIQDEGSSPFAVSVNIANIGEADVGPGSENPFVLVRLLGFVPEQFGTTRSDLSKKLVRKLVGAKRNFDSTILPGEVEVFSFEPLLFKGDVLETSQITMRLDVCYDYVTFATAKICLKDDVLESAQDLSLCSLRGAVPVGNSGGPVQVFSADQTPVSGGKVQVNLQVVHLGRGMHFRRGTEDPNHACEFSLQNRDAFFATLFVKAVDPDVQVTCQGLTQKSPEEYVFGEIRLFDNAPVTVSCFAMRATPIKNRVIQSLLDIKLKYRYGEFVEIPIAIQDVH